MCLVYLDRMCYLTFTGAQLSFVILNSAILWVDVLTYYE